MPRRKSKKKETPPPARTPDSDNLAHHPFQALKGLKIDTSPTEAPEPEVVVPRAESETDLFKAAMAEVIPLARRKKRIPGEAAARRPVLDRAPPEDLEVLAHLEDLVTGRGQFDLVDTDEYLEGYIRGIHPIVLEKLRRGQFSIQAYLDLHGLTAREAEEAVGEFISEAVTLGYRCVLLVHGRGLNSKDQIPVIKKKLETFLLRGPVKKNILAFTSARQVDGGAGASYVLLRAKRR